LIGNSRGNLFPVRASSDTVPPLYWLGLSCILESNALKTSSGRADARFSAKGRYITDGSGIKA